MTDLLPAVLPGLCVLAGLLVGIWFTGGFRRGAIYLPPLVTDPKPPSLTELKPCAVEYKVGDVVLAKSPRGKAETLTITDITETYDGTGHHLMSGKQIIPTNHIIGGYRP